MIKINKKEAMYLRSKGRGNDITVVNVTHHSKAKRWYLTESLRSMELLEEYRNNIILR